jgi:hypothetical protein
MVLQIIPDFLVGIPIGRIRGQIKHMQPRSTFDEGLRHLRRVRPGLVHHEDDVSARLLTQQLLKEIYHSTDVIRFHQAETQVDRWD